MKEIYEELFIDIPKMGPGSAESTQKAYSYLENISPNPKILDIGCGTGAQTIELAKLSKGTLYALDLYQKYLDKLLEYAKQEKVSQYIKVLKKSMTDLDFENEFFDIIWSESSIFIVGFEKGLRDWKKFLKAKGYLVVSDVIWFKDQRPQELEKYWAQEYPDIKTDQENIKIIKSVGYTLIKRFYIAEDEWWTNLYTPLQKKIKKLKKKYKDEPEIMEFLDHHQREIDLFRKYSDYYGYCFYIMRKKE
ncbi:MAG: class I SAM-dependent methyltransferase [Promethearchaeia archaeon]